MNWQIADITAFTQAEYDAAYLALSPSRKERIDRFKRKEDRVRSLAGEILLRSLVKHAYRIECVPVSRENGMPYLMDSALFVSISHSGHIVACAVDEKPIGIDIEQVRPINMAITRRVCTEAEKRYVFGCDPIPEQVGYCEDNAVLRRFFEVWTAKEAYFKKCGTGITNFKCVDILTLDRQVFYKDSFVLQIL